MEIALYLDNLRQNTERLLNASKATVGVYCDIYFPVTSNSIYNNEDNAFTYNSFPSLSKKFLVTGIAQAAGLSFTDLDSYYKDDEINMYCSFKDPVIELGSLVKIELEKESILTLKIDSVSQISKGILFKYILVPV